MFWHFKTPGETIDRRHRVPEGKPGGDEETTKEDYKEQTSIHLLSVQGSLLLVLNMDDFPIASGEQDIGHLK